MMKALTHNIRQEREDQRDRSAQLFMWCIVVSMHQDDGIGASRLLRACNEMDAFEKKYQTAILYGSSKNATDAMRENLKGICDFEVRLPVDRAPRGRREEQLRMASNQGAEIAWLVMAATCHETFGYGRDRLARLKQNSMNNYKQYLEWEKRIRTSPSTVCADAYRTPSKRTSASPTPTTARGCFRPRAEAPAYTRRPLSTRRYSGGPEQPGQRPRSPYTAQRSTTKP